jgi:hypothetical protein
MTSQPSLPRVPRHLQNIAPRNLSQDEFCGMDTEHMAIALGNHNWSHAYQANAVLHRVTGKNGIHGPYGRPPSTTTLDTGFWQRSRAPFSRHLGYSWNRHMFLYQTYKHPGRQKYHLRQNSLRLQTPQKEKELLMCNIMA